MRFEVCHFVVMGAATVAMALSSVHAVELHVGMGGNDANGGTADSRLRTIQRAADLANPGDAIIVHEGVYRERINPPRGGTSDENRITYRAAGDGKVEIKGSEAVTNWTNVKGDVWMAVLPNTMFGAFNPYSDVIRGDWFNPKGREHHTGAVYLEGEWFDEAATLEELLDPGTRETREGQGGDGCLLNVAWIQPGGTTNKATRVPAVGYVSQHGVRNAPCSEEGGCIGWLEQGDWAKYEKIDFGSGADRMEIRAASATLGGEIQIRLGPPNGEIIGSCFVPNTGGWQSWSTFTAKIKPVSGTNTISLVFRSTAIVNRGEAPLWFGRVDETNTTIWAEFKGVDPRTKSVEVNARQTVFYPDKPGVNYITVSGFIMRHAATPWAPPTAEQPGLIGTHWSKGWVIESNIVSHSRCVGIALGKHGDEFDNTSANSAEGYVKTIERAHAHAIPWTRDNIGHHVVRGNTISHCEQAGVVGSLGAAFSSITGNVIHDIHVRTLFTGAEMAGIKIHAAIDCDISANRIFRTCRGLWMDWMAQGTRLSRNLCYENTREDLFMEVNHGPFLVDNNVFLSQIGLLDMSEGGACAHNLWTGEIVSAEELNRETPYHPPHSTKVAGLSSIKGGDNRFFDNVFVGAGPEPDKAPAKADRHRRAAGHGTWMYDMRQRPSQMAGNLYLNGARPAKDEKNAFIATDVDPRIRLIEEGGSAFLQLSVGPEWSKPPTVLVTSEVLGKAAVPNAPYVRADDSPLKIDADYRQKIRDARAPTPGPFENPGEGEVKLKVW